MGNKYEIGYLREAVKAHLDLEEGEFENMNMNNRFHIFANEAMQQICHSRPKYKYFEFQALDALEPLVYDDGNIRKATALELQDAATEYVEEDIMFKWYNDQGLYYVGQLITMPDDFVAFAEKESYLYTDYITNKIPVTNTHRLFLSNSEFVVNYAAYYMIAYQAIWYVFSQDDEDDIEVDMPSDLALTIPIYVASVFLQQRNLSLSQAKRQEFEAALSRCKSVSYLANKSIRKSFE